MSRKSTAPYTLWLFGNRGSFEPCEAEMIKEIEKHYQTWSSSKKKSHEDVFPISFGKYKYTIDFNLMEQMNNYTKKIRTLKRVTYSANVRWEYESNTKNKFQPYTDDYHQALLEHYYQLSLSPLFKLKAKKPCSDATVPINIGDEGYLLNVKEMKQTNLLTKNERRVRRVLEGLTEAEEEPAPPKRVPLSSSVEKKEVEKKVGQRRKKSDLKEESNGSSTETDEDLHCPPPAKRKSNIEESAFSEQHHHLVFPSFSTAVFCFDVGLAAEIGTKCIMDFLHAHPISQYPSIHLTLIDFGDPKTEASTETLDAFRRRWAALHSSARKKPDPRFEMKVADVSIKEQRGPCTFLANAANTRFNGGPTTGGINRAIFLAAGPKQLQEDTQGKYPKGGSVGPCFEVALRKESKLYQEGVRYILHVIGPNMNPLRPNCLDGDYKVGALQLEQCYRNMLQTYFNLAFGTKH